MWFTVYIHKNKTNGKVYVGITSRKPEIRWKNGKGYVQNKHFSSAIEKYGWDGFTHEIVCEGLQKEEAWRIERKLIEDNKSNNPLFGYNNSVGGECSALGAKWTDEMKNHQSQMRKGRELSDEHKEKISLSKTGKSNGKKGYLGKESGNAGIVLQIDEKTKAVVDTFFGYGEMHRKTGFAKTPIRETANGLRKRAYGYLWEYRKVKENVTI